MELPIEINTDSIINRNIIEIWESSNIEFCYLIRVKIFTIEIFFNICFQKNYHPSFLKKLEQSEEDYFFILINSNATIEELTEFVDLVNDFLPF